jgi:hypothetical protein
MSSTNPATTKSADLIARVRAILMTPTATWDRIDVEPTTIGGLYTGYVVILSAIPPLARLIHALLFGNGLFFVSITATLIGSAVAYMLGLVGVFIVALIIDALAPTFGGVKNRTQAFKVAAYSGTAGWVASAFGALPVLGVLGILGLYGLYLLYIGLQRVMKAPQTQALIYTIVTCVVSFIVFIILGLVLSVALLPIGGYGVLMGLNSGFRPSPAPTANLALPGGGSVNLGQMAAAAAAAKAGLDSSQGQAPSVGGGAPAGAVHPVAPEALKALLPLSIGDYARTEVSAAGGGVAGLSAAGATAHYVKPGGGDISLEVTDVGVMGAMAGAVDVDSSKETATGYEKIGKIDGRLTTETWDSANRSGKYSVLVASRFMVEASGTGVNIDQLKTAVSSVGLSRLESLAHAG